MWALFTELRVVDAAVLHYATELKSVCKPDKPLIGNMQIKMRTWWADLIIYSGRVQIWCIPAYTELAQLALGMERH